MDIVQLLPVEVVEQIFEGLSTKQLGRCCQVSVAWRKAVNGLNKIWYEVCKQRYWADSNKLCESTPSNYENPTKRFAFLAELEGRDFSQFCLWRLIFEQYLWVNINYRRGSYAKHVKVLGEIQNTYLQQIDEMPLSCNGHIAPVQLGVNRISYWDVHGTPKEIGVFESTLDNIAIKNLFIFGDTIVFSQLGLIKVMHIANDKIKTKFTKIVGLGEDTHVNPNNDNNNSFNENVYSTKELVVKLSKHYVIAAVFSECVVYIWSSMTGESSDVLNLKKNWDKISAMTVHESSLFLSMCCNENGNYVLNEYNLRTKRWGLNLSSSDLIQEILVNNLCVLIIHFQNWPREQTVKVWDRKNSVVLKDFKTKSFKTYFQLYRNLIMYSDETYFNVLSIIPYCLISLLQFNCNIHYFIPIEKNIVVMKSNHALQVWDWEHGQLLYTASHRVACCNFWCDDIRILIVDFLQSCRLKVLGFW